ncbi:MAG: cysteine desulfurase [Anaerolineales bacterium]|uniref:aminotransferase class V-fold PLP-dependent enzyme n=1 Tax=Promineifilum sp. TaxID=2664178 RepID=UPI001E06614D|nr:cysteine desulfurase [Anaerolineales bacterium]MCB8934878.1 cysteine desulfurase [Promineifilum sp.]MCO5178519.1 cysteine desulfurase [Promineifilum sp.]
MLYDVEQVRVDFPILGTEVYPGIPLVYLDSAASSQKPTVVIEAMDKYYRTSHANVHRGVHRLSELATTAYEGARATVARFIGAAEPEQIIFVGNATEGFNLVAQSWGRTNIGPGDEILLTEMEHHANIVPWQMLAQEKGATIRYLPVTDDGYLVLDKLDEFLSERTRLFSFAAVSNVLGTINPVWELVDAAHRVGALAMIDAAQSVPHMAVDVQALDCDFLAFSSHKMCGPTGIGVLYGKRELLQAMPPFLGGGDMIRRVTFDGFLPNDLPWKFEAGTPRIAEAIGLGAAVDYLSSLDMDAVHAHEQAVTGYALESLSEVPGLTLLGPPGDHRGGLAAFTIEGLHPHDIAEVLDKDGIAIRAGHHCAMPLHHRLGLNASARASFYVYTTFEEVDKLTRALHRARSVFRLN